MQVFTNTRNRNVIYKKKKARLIPHVIHPNIFTAPPAAPSLLCSTGNWEEFVLLLRFLHK